MKRIALLLIILFLIAFQLIGQSIELNSTGFFINTKQITNQYTLDSIVYVLGEPDREFKGISDIWTYDELGLYIYFHPQKLTATNVGVDFKKGTYDFSPSKEFSGEFILLGTQLTQDTPLASLKEIDELNFKEGRSIKVYAAQTSNLNIVFEYLDSLSILNGIGVHLGY